jgi:hypothetical protein
LIHSLNKNEYRIFKAVEITIRRGLRQKEENRDEPIWVIIHIFMEMSQGNSLYLKQIKMSFYFSSIKSQNRKVLQVLYGDFGTSERGEAMEKGCRSANIVQILCTHVCKWKMIPVESTPEMGEEGIKENDGRG